jgi:flagellar basal body-associated protein FliL
MDDVHPITRQDPRPMSEPTQDPRPDAPEGAAATPAPARPAPNPPLVVLIAVVVLALGAGATLGGLLLAPRLVRAKQAAAASEAADPHGRKGKRDRKDKKEKKDKKGETGKSPVYKLDNIIVNPAGSQGQRFLMCSVAIESEDSRALDVLREHEIELRDRVVTMLSQIDMERLTAQGARDSLRAELLATILPVLGPDGEDVELKVYLPQFVVQ